jgi:hypothetical protein
VSTAIRSGTNDFDSSMPGMKPHFEATHRIT